MPRSTKCIFNTSVVQFFFFNNGCKGDPQKALLKDASMRTKNAVAVTKFCIQPLKR